MLNKDLALVKIIQEAPHIRTFWFGLPESIPFKPGQFFMITRDISGEKIKRAYSCANTPTIQDHIEFTLDLVPNGKMSGAMFSLSVGDTCLVQGPYGKFVYDDATTHAVFIGGGTGCAPLRAMIYYIIAKGIHIPLTYMSSSKLPEDIIYKTELDELSKKNSNLKVVHTVTRLDEHANWAGERGRISVDMIKKYVPNILSATFYLCGPPGLVSGAENQLIEAGVSNTRIRKEQWG